MLSRPPPSWSHLPEEPLAPVPEPPLYMRPVFWLRMHGFKIVLVVTMGIVVFVFREFARLSEASDAAAQARVERSQAAVAGGAYASLSVTTVPGDADVYLDGDFIGRTPLRRVRVAPGTYRLSVQKAEHLALDSTIEARAEALISLSLPLGQAPTERAQKLPQVAETRPRATPRASADDPPDTRNEAAVPTPVSPAPAEATQRPDETPVTVTTGRLRLHSTPTGAEVWLKERRVGTTPMTLDLEPGEYVATFKKEGYESPTTLFTVVGGQTRVIEPRLNALRGTVRVLAKPWGTIYLDGELVQDATNVRFSKTVVPGPVRITVVHPLLGRWEKVAIVEPGGTVSFVVDFNAQNDSADGDS